MLTTSFVPGSPNWLDVSTPDTAATTAFYSGLFGWDAVSLGPDAGGYGFFQLGGKTVAAYGPLPNADATPSWTAYYTTADVDLSAKAVEDAGGTVLAEPYDVDPAGRTDALPTRPVAGSCSGRPARSRASTPSTTPG